MARASKSRQAEPQPVERERTRKRIGFIGRRDISAREAEILVLIGKSLARLGHTLVTIPTEGATARVREGVEAEKGELLDIPSGVLESSDHTLLYPDPHLLQRLRDKYPALETEHKVTVLQPHQLETFWSSMRVIMGEQGVPIPT